MSQRSSYILHIRQNAPIFKFHKMLNLQIRQIISTFKFSQQNAQTSKFDKMPQSSNFTKCLNLQIRQNAPIFKFHKMPQPSNSTKCPNLQISHNASTFKFDKMPQLLNFPKCLNVQILVLFDHTRHCMIQFSGNKQILVAKFFSYL
ncbi:hypothetical protein ACQ4LE_005219 [Meloidogyne hapla]